MTHIISSREAPLPVEKPSFQLRRLAVSPSEAAAMLGCGRTKFYEILAANEIASIKLGARRLIRVSDIEAWLARRASGA